MSLPDLSSRFRLIPIFLGQAAGLVCGLVSVKLNSHLIPPEVLGGYGVFLTFAPIGMWVVHAGLLKFISRHWAAAPHPRALAREILTAWMERLPWLAGLVIIATWALLPFGSTSGSVVWFVLFFSAALHSFTALAQNALQAERAHWRDCAIATTNSVTRSFVPPLLYAAAGGASTALLIGFNSHALAVALVAGWAWNTTLGPEATPPNAARTLTGVYDGPLFIALAVAAWMLSGLNRWIVAWFFGNVEVGYFTLAGGAAAIVSSMLGMVIIQYVQPGMFAMGDGPDGSRATLARRTDLIALAYTVIALAGLAVVNAIAPLLIGTLISPNYSASLVWIIPAGCFGITTMTALFYHTMLLAGRCERACGPVDLTTAGILFTGCLLAAAAGKIWFISWLMFTPLVPWVLTRLLARYYLFKLASTPALSPDR
jgi:hypothetical protein